MTHTHTHTHSNTHANSEFHFVFRQANDNETSPENLARLSRSADELIRGAVALNEATPKSVLCELLNDPSSHVLGCLRRRGYQTRPVFIKPKKVVGNNLIFRNATEEDAAFILELRTDAKKSQHISKTSADLVQQQAWLGKYSGDSQQVYFVILNKDLEKVGTVRLYDIRDNSFCWGFDFKARISKLLLHRICLARLSLCPKSGF